MSEEEEIESLHQPVPQEIYIIGHDQCTQVLSSEIDHTVENLILKGQRTPTRIRRNTAESISRKIASSYTDIQSHFELSSEKVTANKVTLSFERDEVTCFCCLKHPAEFITYL